MLNKSIATPEQLELWQKIQAFKFDAPGTQFRFSDRLARENGWRKSYALRVIDEYKKFIFLSAVSPRPLTPSDPVDQVWHLHLTYTKSYWKDLCEGVLQKEFHHNPTKGGAEEQQKFDGFYDYSFQQYVHFFEENPPPDIWQNADTRFKEINFVRVNKDRNYIVEKPVNLPLLVLFATITLGAFAVLIWISPWFSMLIPVFVLVGLGIRKIIIIDVSAYKSKGSKDGNGGDAGCGGCSGGHSGCGGCSGGGCGGCN